MTSSSFIHSTSKVTHTHTQDQITTTLTNQIHCLGWTVASVTKQPQGPIEVSYHNSETFALLPFWLVCVCVWVWVWVCVCMCVCVCVLPCMKEEEVCHLPLELLRMLFQLCASKLHYIIRDHSLASVGYSRWPKPYILVILQ